MTMETIYIVEDDDNIRKLVCYALNHENYTALGFSLPSQFYRAFEDIKPDLVLLDIMLPEESGLEILRKIRSYSPDMPIIMLTAKDSEFDKVTGLDMGADDYIAKPFGMTELISRVRAVLRRSSRGNSRQVYKFGILAIDTEKHVVTVSDKPVALSFKEFSLLEILIKAGGKVVAREELFTKVWGDFYGESRTLDVHIRNLRKKLGNAGNYIRTVKNIGYRIGEKNE